MKKNREEEEIKIKNFFEMVMNSLTEKMHKSLEEMNNLFVEDAKNFTNKLEQSSKKIEIAETIKFSLNEVMEHKGIDITSVFDAYFEFNTNYQQKSDHFLNSKEYKYTYDSDPTKLFKLIDDYSVIKTRVKQLAYSSRYSDPIYPMKNMMANKNNNVNSYIVTSNYIVNTNQNDYNSVMNTEDYFGEKKAIKSYFDNSEAANRIGRNDKKEFDYSRLKKELNYQNNIHSINNLYTSNTNGLINTLTSTDYSKSSKINFIP